MVHRQVADEELEEIESIVNREVLADAKKRLTGTVLAVVLAVVAWRVAPLATEMLGVVEMEPAGPNAKVPALMMVLPL